MTALDPITATGVRRISPVQIGLCSVAIISAAVWTFWPMGSAETVREPTSAVPADAPTEWKSPELRIAAFSAPLWVAPPAPPPPPPPEPKSPPPPPLKIQLLAVVNNDGVYEAVLFDPDADKLYTLREGESLGARTVERVSASGVDLRDVAGVRTLALRDKGGKP